MGVIPEGTSLVSRLEIIEERVVRGNRTLCNERHAVVPVGLFLLEDTMPVLLVMSIASKMTRLETYNARTAQHSRVFQLVNYEDLETIPLVASNYGPREGTTGKDSSEPSL